MATLYYYLRVCVCVCYIVRVVVNTHNTVDTRGGMIEWLQCNQYNQKNLLKKKKFDMSACASNVSMTGFDFSVRMEREPFFFYFILY